MDYIINKIGLLEITTTVSPENKVSSYSKLKLNDTQAKFLYHMLKGYTIMIEEQIVDKLSDFYNQIKEVFNARITFVIYFKDSNQIHVVSDFPFFKINKELAVKALGSLLQDEKSKIKPIDFSSPPGNRLRAILDELPCSLIQIISIQGTTVAHFYSNCNETLDQLIERLK